MRVLVFAYRGEAQAFLDGYQLSKTVEGLYFHANHPDENPAIFIAKEGIEANIFGLTKVMQELPEVTEVVNLGIVGGLNPSLEAEKILDIQTVYCHIAGEQTRHQSYVLKNTDDFPHTCITSHVRVLDVSQKKYLAKFADVVDRELWGIAYALSKYPQVKLHAIKCVADAAADQLECKEVIQKAQQYSEALKTYYAKHYEKPNNSKSEALPLAMTRTQSVMYQKYQAKLLTIWQQDEFDQKQQEFLSSLPAKMHHKQKMKPLLEWMERHAYPEIFALKNQAHKLLKPLALPQGSYSFDERLDHHGIDLRCHIGSKQGFNELKQSLERFDYDAWLQFFGRS